jgi:EthD domain
MIKFMIAVHRSPGLTHQEAMDHLEFVHGKLVATDPAKIVRYVQNHISDGAYGTLAAGWSGPQMRDSIAEIYFHSLEDQKESTSAEYYLNVLKPDEPNFADQSSVLVMVTRELEVKPASDAGNFKLLHYLKCAPSLSRTGFLEQWNQLQTQLLESTEIASKLSRAVQSLPLFEVPNPGLNAPNFYDLVVSLWFDSQQGIDLYRAHFKQIKTDILEPAKSFMVMAKELTLVGESR